MAGFLDYANAAKLFLGKKVVWTLHDMNPFTGGCHYTGSCRGYLYKCGVCPQLGSLEDEDASANVWQIKDRTFRDLDLAVVTPSKWLGECSSISSLFRRFKHYVIPNGFPLEVFKPLDRDIIRAELGIPENAKVVLFGADSTNQRKGFRFLIAALKHLYSIDSTSNMILAMFGAVYPDEELECGFPIYNFSYIENEEQMTLLYNAADVFLLPSLEDNLPNTVIESFASGTPVAAFNIGGVPDMIEHGITGYLATPEDAVDLANAITWCIIDAPSKIRQDCRAVAESYFSLETLANNYLALYKSL